jgi:hypothetical protein
MPNTDADIASCISTGDSLQLLSIALLYQCYLPIAGAAADTLPLSAAYRRQLHALE